MYAACFKNGSLNKAKCKLKLKKQDFKTKKKVFNLPTFSIIPSIDAFDAVFVGCYLREILKFALLIEKMFVLSNIWLKSIIYITE